MTDWCRKPRNIFCTASISLLVLLEGMYPDSSWRYSFSPLVCSEKFDIGDNETVLVVNCVFARFYNCMFFFYVSIVCSSDHVGSSLKLVQTDQTDARANEVIVS